MSMSSIDTFFFRSLYIVSIFNIVKAMMLHGGRGGGGGGGGGYEYSVQFLDT